MTSIEAFLIAAALQATPATTQEKPLPPEAPATAAPSNEFSALEVLFKDGLRFRTRDGNFDARLGGRMLTHYRTVVDRPDDSTAGDGLRTVPDSFFVRQARLELEGTVMKEFGYRVQTDFGTGLYNQGAGTGPANTTGTLRDAYVEWVGIPEFKIRAGQFFEAVSQEDITSTRFIEFAERSDLNRLLPGREIGLQVSGICFDKRLEYFAMVCNGTGLLNDSGRAVSDANDEKEVSGLLRVTPFAGTDLDALKSLRLGIGASIGDADNAPVSGFDLVSTQLSVMYLSSTGGGSFDGTRWRLDPQISWAWGPLGFRAEYLRREDELAHGTAVGEIRSAGWYAYVTCILTGEDKKFEDRILPKSRWGALEVAFRYAVLNIDHLSESGVAVAQGNADRINSITAGLNWWITRNVRITANAILERFDDEVAFDNRAEDSLFGFLFRAQVDF